MKKGGYTLVELMIAISVIGILAAIIVPNYSRMTDSARAMSAVSVLEEIRLKQEQYRQETREYKDIENNEKLKQYLGIVPETDFFIFRFDSETATAKLTRKLGGANSGDTISLKMDGTKDANDDLKPLLTQWLNN